MASLAAQLYFCGLLGAAAVCDLRAFRIPNILPLLLLAGGLAFALIRSGADASWPVSLAIMIVAGAVLFAFRLMGGGDAKLLMSMAVWIPPQDLAAFAFLLALFGTVQGLCTLAWVRLVPAQRARFVRGRMHRMPYGLSIALAGGAWSLLGGHA